ncbi:hypothetical protein ACPEIC_46590 [Stenotrophomonas sp. NPDC087984]
MGGEPEGVSAFAAAQVEGVAGCEVPGRLGEQRIAVSFQTLPLPR